MATFQLVIGVVLVGLGLVYILRRDRLAQREGSRPNIGRTGWIVAGVAFVLAGVVQLLNAAV